MYGQIGIVACVYCGMKTNRVKLDCKGRPYLRCAYCETLTFIKTDQGLEGLRKWGGFDFSFLSGIKEAGVEKGRELAERMAKEVAV